MTRSLVVNFPTQLRLEPTNACNLRCAFCQNQRTDKKKEFIDTKSANTILTDAYNAGARDVGFFLFGEPLLHPELNVLVSDARRLGFSHIYITSNGVLADRERVKSLFEAGLNSLQFSINAANRERYALIHGYDYFDKVMRNFFDAVSLRDMYRSQGKVCIEGKGGCSVRVSFVHSPDENSKSEMECLKERLAAYCDEFKPREEFRGNGFPIFDAAGEGCRFPFDIAFVNASAELLLCCHDFQGNTKVADLTEERIAHAWNGPIMQAARKSLLTRDFMKDCKKCMINFL